MTELLALPSLSAVEQEELNRLKVYNDELERNKKITEDQKADKEEQKKNDTEAYIDKVWNSSGVDKSYYIDTQGVIHKDEGWGGFFNSGVNTKDALDTAIQKYETYSAAENARSEVLANLDDYKDDISYDEYKKMYLARYGYESSTTEEDYNENVKQYVDANKMIEEINDRVIGNWGEKARNIKNSIIDVFADENFEGLSYGMSEDIDAFLDEQYAYRLKLRKADGEHIVTDAISSMFDATASQEMQALGTELRAIMDDDSIVDKNQAILDKINGLDGITDASLEVDKLSDSYNRLKTTMDIAGVTAQDISDYFVLETGTFDSNTVEGITAQYQKGIDVLRQYKDAGEGVNAIIGTWKNNVTGEIENITWGSLFKDGEVVETQISKVLQGADETTRTEFARIAKAVNEGKMSVDNAMKSFSISGVQAGYKLLENAVVEINSDIFKDLGDEISGLIDTFDEFGSALESVANSIELVNQAQAEMAHSGHVSVETALDLINSTDNWNEVLTIENGNIKLVDGAMNILAQSKLNQIKTNLQLALSEAQAGLEQARLAQNSDEVAKTLEESTTESVRQLSANMGYLSTLIGEFLDGNFFGAHKSAKVAKQQILDDTEYQKTDTASSMSVADWEEKVSNIEAKLGILEGVDTTGEFQNNYSSDKISGGNGTKEDVIKSKWDQLISKYENELALITNERDRIQAEIDQIEAQGGKASEKHYADLAANQLKEKQLLEEKKDKLEEYLRTYGDSIDPDTWTEYNNEINATAVAIKECTTNIYEFAKSLRELDMHYFEQTIDDLSRMGGEIDFILSLFDNEDMVDDEGNWTEAGITKINLLRDKLTLYAATANEYKKQLDELDKMETVTDENGVVIRYKFDEEFYNNAKQSLNDQLEQGVIDSDEYNALLEDLDEAYANGGFSVETFNEWKDTYTDGYREAISAGQDVQDELIDMNDERVDKLINGVEREISAYEDYIDTVKEALDAERDLYDFKRNIEKGTKDIAALERRISALSGSTDAADIAERRKLEAELVDAKSNLNDQYYDHARSAQSNALDDEADAYRTAKEKYIEILEESRDDTVDILNDMFLNGILNADVALKFLEGLETKYNIPVSKKLKEPWEEASKKADEFKDYLSSEGYLTSVNDGVVMISDKIKNILATEDPDNAWTQATAKADAYADFLTTTDFVNFLDDDDETAFEDQVQTIVDGWDSIASAANNAYDAQVKAGGVGGNPNLGEDDDDSGVIPDGNTEKPGKNPTPSVAHLQRILNQFFSAKLSVDGLYGPATKSAVANMQNHLSISPTGLYDQKTKDTMQKWLNQRNVGSWFKQMGFGIPAAMYAKGTLGTSYDQWAITDESWIGEEITLAAGKNGQLQYLKKGSAIMPADISANLVEWGKLNPNMMNMPSVTPNINMISNAVNKPELNFAFDALVKAENITEETLPAVKKLVTQELNRFTRELNYALKGKGAR